MRLVSAFLAAVTLLLTLLTAAWRSEALETLASNYQLEREVDTLERQRDGVREQVALRRQPFALRLRRAATKTVEVAKAGKPEKKSQKAGARKTAPIGTVSP